MERITCIIVAPIGVILTGCATDPGRGGVDIRPVTMPEWSYTGEHPDYPTSEYLVAFGLARNAREASATAEERLEMLICDEAIASHAMLFRETRFADIVTEPAAWFQLGEFGNAIKQDSASNGFEAVEARAISKNELKLRAKSLLQTAQAELAEEPQPPRGLGTISTRMEMWGSYFLLAVRVVALELLASDTLNRTAFDKVEESLLALWELPALIKTDIVGSGQHARIHGGCAQPIGLGAYFRGKPVTGVPLEWGPGAGFAGTVQGDTELNEFGRASAKVLYLRPTGDDFGYVQARLDLNRVAGRRLGVAMNVWLWQVKLPSRKSGELVLKIKETSGGELPVGEPLFQPEVKKWGEGRRLSVRVIEPDGKDPGNEKAQYHLLLEGEVDVSLTTTNNIPSAYVAGSFSLSDMETGEVLFRYSLGLKRTGKEGNTEASIRLLATQDGAAEVMAEFASRILVTLPGKDEEFGRDR